MCLQCVAEAKEVIREIVPGYSLYIATKDAPDEWPVGHYGVVQMNDPLFVFPPLPEPPETEDTPLTEFDNLAIKLSTDIGFSLMEGYAFTSACIAAGYSPEEDGHNVMWWFLLHVAKRLKEATVVPRIVASENVLRATLKLIAADFLPQILDNLIIGNLAIRSFEPVPAAYNERVVLDTPGHPEAVMLPYSTDFFIPDITRVLAVPELLSVQMKSAVDAMSNQIERYLRKTIEAADQLVELPQHIKCRVVSHELFETLKTTEGFKLYDSAADAGVRAIIQGPVGVLDGTFIFPSRFIEDVAFPSRSITLGMRRCNSVPSLLEEYAEIGNFGIKVSTEPDPHHLRQRYFIEIMMGAIPTKNESK